MSAGCSAFTPPSAGSSASAPRQRTGPPPRTHAQRAVALGERALASDLPDRPGELAGAVTGVTAGPDRPLRETDEDAEPDVRELFAEYDAAAQNLRWPTAEQVAALLQANHRLAR